MDFSELILKRQSDRKYAPGQVAREHIVKCLEASPTRQKVRKSLEEMSSWNEY